jgi:hypothetical protein
MIIIIIKKRCFLGWLLYDKRGLLIKYEAIYDLAILVQ